ncbi:phosphatidylinositol-specific phospholipase C1-like protein [Mucilaginibacter lacusdianchii]|uniref:phosphatidylinositol-specific phospholipase C1-like protein n=1 Tax=Mucilaginibacter lacusdianchii TaxID=2684211 RepID=UPI00131B0C0D|nr:phosphatidylinositol-specific phospholipase C1-like protein [Mucilaginibacter sp. JXJ CY 39]
MKTLLALLAVGAILTLKSNDPDNLPINKIQVIGSHNSYKKAIDPALFKVFQKQDLESAAKLDYEHIPIIDQLNMGLLNLELDTYIDDKGGKYAHPKGLDWAKNQPTFDTARVMLKPGFKMLHVPELDFRSHYLTFEACLRDLKAWSEAHPDHYPIFITLEPKDGKSKNPTFTVPEVFTARAFDKLDSTISHDLGKEHLITPDMVRGKYETLESAVLHQNWPTLKNAKGKFIFLLDAKDAKRDLYIAEHPSLKGRVLFANAEPGTPEAAMMFRNDPKDPEISGLVKKGYIIRTRADADTQQARANDQSDMKAAFNSGAQIVTTDYYLKSTHFKSDYVVRFDGNSKYFRVNPLFTSDATASKSK